MVEPRSLKEHAGTTPAYLNANDTLSKVHTPNRL
jgi:hypothetical protein